MNTELDGLATQLPTWSVYDEVDDHDVIRMVGFLQWLLRDSSDPQLLKVDRIVVEDDTDQTGFRPVGAEEVLEPEFSKYYLDAWGNPYVLIRKEDGTFRLYSLGPDGEDQTLSGTDSLLDSESDDIVRFWP